MWPINCVQKDYRSYLRFLIVKVSIFTLPLRFQFSHLMHESRLEFALHKVDVFLFPCEYFSDENYFVTTIGYDRENLYFNFRFKTGFWSV